MKHKWYKGTCRRSQRSYQDREYSVDPDIQNATSAPKLVDHDMTPKKWYLVQTVAIDFELLPMGRNGYSIPTESTFAKRQSTRSRDPSRFSSMACTADAEAYVI